MAREVRIFCPRCRWEPQPGDRWLCSPCGCVWNTFETGGVCPDCGKAWHETKCLRCGSWSPHSDWYHQFGEDPIHEKIEQDQEDAVPLDS